MLISTIEPDEIIRRTPEIIHTILRQLEVLFESRTISASKILASFTEVDNSEYFEQPWGKVDEFAVSELKDMINDNEFRVSRHTDTRQLVQVVLDFLEGISGPPISRNTVEHLYRYTIRETQMSTEKHAVMSEKSLLDNIHVDAGHPRK